MSTTEAIHAAPANFSPEFVDAKGLRALFGISRAHGYNLAADGKIKSVSLRQPGALRGKRLFDCASIRAFIRSQMEAAQ